MSVLFICMHYKLPIMRYRLLIAILFFTFISHLSFAQFTDGFTDGNFTSNPVWSGNTSIFTVISGELRNNDTGAGTSYLSTPSTATNEWVFQVRMEYNPSSSNYSRVYLMSDNADLSASVLKGYYVEFGRSGDDIDLVKQNDATKTTIIAGSGSVMNVSNNNVRVKVTRSAAGVWTLKADLTGGTNFSTDLGTVTDNDYTSTTHFGVYCVYTSTRKDKIFFDNIEVAQPPAINTVNATSSSQLDVTFTEDVDQTTAETLTNYSVNNSVGNPTAATQDGTNKNIVHLTFANSFAASNILTVQNVKDLPGNAITVAQTANFNIDITPPSISKVELLSATTIDVTFSENVDQTTAETLTNYLLDNSGGNPATATQDGSNKALVHLTFGTSFTDLVNYTLTIQNVKDLPGNVLTSATGTFQYLAPYTPANRDVVINEIFADPSPQVGLPTVEYVELYNATNRPIDLTGWKLDGVNTSGFPSFILKSGEYVVLTDAGNESLFSGNVISWGGSGALTNGGETLILKNASDVEVDQVTYTSEWYNDTAKDGGGYSLEQINPATRCTGVNNWTASGSASGGTPGAQNSVYDTSADQVAPKINLTSLKNDSTLTIQFSETMDSVKLKDKANYSFDNGLTVKSVTVIAPAYSVAEVLFTGTPQTGTAYNVTTTNLTDCIGNALSGSTARFGKGASPAYHELIITEMLADPTPAVGLPEREYIEIFNRSANVLELKGVQIADVSGTATLSELSIFPGEYIILTGTSGVSDLSSLGQAMGVSSFPSLANSGELLTLRNASGQLLHSVHYLDTWYQDDTKKEGGYSLEIIDTDNPCGEADNWKASTSSTGGTPGKENSVKAANPDANAPQLLKAEALTTDTITVTFNEKMDSTSLTTATYALNNNVSVQSFEVVASEFKQVKLIVASSLQLKTVYTLTVTNANDCSGNTIAANNTYNFAVAEQGDSLDIVLNEVLFNPRTGGVDFVEIYNNSDKYINLKDWKLANIDSDGNLASEKVLTAENDVLPPKYYRILTSDKANIQTNYPKASDSTFLVMTSLPSYNDDAGSVILINNLDKQMERFDYNADFHFPLIDDKNGVSLERISFTAETNNQNSWHSAASTVGYATPGYFNSQTSGATSGGDNITLDYQAITPNGDGDRDFVTINYKFAQSGVTINMTIYDKRGREVKALVKNGLAATEGFYTWDGTNDSGQKVGMGYYIIYVETFELNGTKQGFKKPIVVGARF